MKQILNPLKTTRFLTQAAIITGFFFAAGSALAADADGFSVKSSSDGLVRVSVKAFENGEYERSVRLSQKALDANPSKRRAALIYSNLCAGLGEMGDMQAASEACSASLELRPEYAPAMANYAALKVHVAETASDASTASGAE